MTETETKIVFRRELPIDLIKILCILCIQLQAEFDISPSLLDKIINSDQYINNCLFLYQQYYHSMINQVNKFKSKYVPLLDTEAQRNYDINEREYEKCGYLKKIYGNGYMEYCNYHKYLHPHPDLPDHSSEIEHLFVNKNKDCIIKETYHHSIYILYQNYLNQLYFLMNQLFHHLINTSCTINPFKVDLHISETTNNNSQLHVTIRNSEEIYKIIDQMKHDMSIFKSKVLYEHIEPTQITDKVKSYYYIKVYNFKN